MPSSAASARRFLISCCAAVGLLAAAGGCRSGQSAYQFRPGPAVAHAPRPTAATQPPPAVAPVLAAAKVEAPVARPSVAARLVRRAPAHRSPVPPKHLAKRLPQMGRLAYGAALQPAGRRAGTTDGVQAVAEVGLGTTVLGVLGLVVGPISLIGLLIWGGPVWAVLLGLSALAVLVAYLDPFR